MVTPSPGQPGNPAGVPGGQTGIHVRTKFFFLSFLLYFFKPRLHLDDGPAVTQPWGDTFIPTPPGPHRVRCYIPYLFFSTMGDSSIDVVVPPNGVVAVQWRAPLTVFTRGRWRVTSEGPGPAGAAGYPTPGPPPGDQPPPGTPYPPPSSPPGPAPPFAG